MSRESELYKDKIEVSLDGRQIFYLFFGGAVIVGLVFVLGVMVGRRVEARGHIDRAKTQAAVDPLAALDRLEGGSGLSFQGALRGAETPTPDVEKQIGELAKSHEEPQPQPPSQAADKKADDKKADDKKKAEDKKPSDAKAADVDKKPRFTLQLSSFQDKDEAAAYLAQLKSSGSASAYLTEADVDGKTFFRVRLGNYRTVEAANDAKVDFEKTSKKSASVMRL